MEFFLTIAGCVVGLIFLALPWHFLNSDKNPLVARAADEFIRQAKTMPLRAGQTEQKAAVNLALAAGKRATAAVIYQRLYGVSIFDARKEIDRIVTLRILTS